MIRTRKSWVATVMVSMFFLFPTCVPFPGPHSPVIQHQPPQVDMMYVVHPMTEWNLR